MLRKIISFIVASAIFGAGIWLIVAEALWFQIIWGKLLFAGALLIAVGGYWLWVDYRSSRLHLN
jgi:hypothetical protein